MSPVHDRQRRIDELLNELNIYTELRALILFGLTDDQTPNPHPVLERKQLPLSAGAGTAKLFGWAASRLGVRRFDREMRDYVFPQLMDMGLVDKALILSNDRALLSGVDVEIGVHEPKSPNNAYVATGALVNLLRKPDSEWREAKAAFVRGDVKRRRKTVERRAAVAFGAAAPNQHAALIRTAVEALRQTIASEYELVFIDDADGDRVADAYRERLEALNLLPDLASKWPDAILCNGRERLVWFVDAVTTDGEIDDPRAESLTTWAAERGYGTAGLTTAYATWRRAASRQGRHRNLAIGSTLWIAEDGGRLLEVHALVPELG